MESHRNKIM